MMSWGKPVQPVALCRLHSCQLETSYISLRYAKRRIQWYWLIPAPEVSRSGSEHTLGLELSMRTLARWHRWSITASFVLHVTSLLLPLLLFTVEFFTGAVFQLRGVPAVFGRAQKWGRKISWIQKYNEKCYNTEEQTPEPRTSCVHWLDTGEMRKPQISLPLLPSFPKAQEFSALLPGYIHTNLMTQPSL